MNPGVLPFRLRSGPDQLTLDRMPPHRTRARPPAEDSFSAVLGRAIEVRGISLLALQRRLADRGHRVSAGTLSYWRSGQRLPEKPTSLDAVTEIEDLLGLDPGTLHGRIGPSRRPGPPLPQVAAGAAAPADVPVQEALRELGLADAGQELQDITLHITVDVDAERQMTRQTVRTMLRATASGAQRWYHVIFAEQPVPEPLFLEQVVGARVGATVDRPEVGLVASELVLPRPLEVGETAIIETSNPARRPGRPGHDVLPPHRPADVRGRDLGAVRRRGAAHALRADRAADEGTRRRDAGASGRARHRPRGGAVVRTGQRRPHVGVVNRR